MWSAWTFRSAHSNTPVSGCNTENSSREVKFPELAVVVLIGTSGSGKSTFARRRFRPTEAISSDYCRALVSDDENDQSATKAAFEILNFIVGKRLKAGRLTVVDATNVRPRGSQVPCCNHTPISHASGGSGVRSSGVAPSGAKSLASGSRFWIARDS